MFCVYFVDCYLYPNPGIGNRHFIRYYYNSQSGRCQTFTYRGKGGNHNNFQTLELCKSKR